MVTNINFVLWTEPAEQLPRVWRADGGRQGVPLLPDDDGVPADHVPPQSLRPLPALPNCLARWDNKIKIEKTLRFQ